MATLAHDPVFVLVLRAACALLFASAARYKLGDRAAFRNVLASYRVVLDAAAPFVAAAVPAVELGVACAWLVPSVATLAAGGTVVLLAVYSLAIAANLARGRRTLDCGCGIGGTKQPISEWMLVRNAFLAAAALFASRPVTVRPLVWVDALTVAGGLAVASATWMAAHGLAAASARVPRLAPAERAS